MGGLLGRDFLDFPQITRILLEEFRNEIAAQILQILRLYLSRKYIFSADYTDTFGRVEG